MEKKPITPEGQTKLRSELDHLKNIKRQEIIDAISEARAHGDLKENAEYHAAREEQGLNEARIRELEEVLSVSQVVEYKTLGVEDRVIFGSTVTIKDLESAIALISLKLSLLLSAFKSGNLINFWSVLDIWLPNETSIFGEFDRDFIVELIATLKFSNFSFLESTL